MKPIILTHLPGGGSNLNGEENEIVLFDGEGGSKQSDFFIEPSLYEYPLTQPFIIRNEIASMDLWVTGLKVEDVTDPMVPVTVYDLLTDPNFTSINTTSSPVYCSSTPIIATSPRSLKLGFLLGNNASQNQDRAIYYRRSDLDPNKTYKFTIIFNGTVGGHQVAISDGTNRSHVQSTPSGNRIIFYVNDATRRMNVISVEKQDTLVENTVLCGDKTKKTPAELNTTHFLALSGKARIAVHDQAAIDATEYAQLRLHGDAQVDIDGSTRLRMHEYATLEMDGSGKARIHGGTIDMISGYLKMDDRNLVLSMRNQSDIGQVGGLVLSKQSSVANGPKVFFSNDCRFSVNGFDAAGPYFSLNPGQLFIGGVKDSLNMTPDANPPSGGNGPVIAVEGASAVLIGRGGGESSDTPGYAGKTWIKISPNGVSDVCQLHLTGNIFIQHSGNSHEEMHNDSIFVMRNNGPVNTRATEQDGKNLYESKNLVVIPINTGSSGTIARAEIKTMQNGIVKNRPVLAAGGGQQPSLYNASVDGVRLAGTNVSNQVFSYSTTAEVSFWAGNYSYYSPNTWVLVSNVPTTLVRQGASSEIINKLYELPEGASGVFWEDLTPEERQSWITLASTMHLKVLGSPKFEMVGDSEITLENGCTITGDEAGLKVNGDPIVTDSRVATLEAQVADLLARVAALEA
jgi:hypothetical protein